MLQKLRRFRDGILRQVDRSALGKAISSHPIHATTFALILFALLMFSWVFVAEVDRVVVAQGVSITSEPKYTIKPLNKSIIRNLHVKVGMSVLKGAPIVTLDPTTSNADVKKLSEKFESHQAEVEKIEAILNGKLIEPNSRTLGDWKLQERSLRSEQLNFQQKSKQYDQKIAGSVSYLRELVNKHKILKEQITVAKETRDMWDELVNVHQFGSRTSYLKAQNDLLQLQSQLSDNLGEQVKASHERDSLIAEKRSYIGEWESKRVGDLVSTQRDMREAKQELIKAETENRMVTLTAFEDAFILEVADISEGSVVTPSDTLVKMIPLNSKISVEMKISARDISYVSVGQDVDIKLDSLPYQRYGQLQGKVFSVTRDSFRDDGQSENGGSANGGNKKSSQSSGDVYYIARIDIIGSGLRNTPETFHLIPGLSLTGDIKVGKRPLREFLLFPLQKAMREGLREP